MAKKVIVLLANGFEDVEAVTPIDYLRRAGAEVTVAGVGGTTVNSSRGLVVQADVVVAALGAEPWDAVVVPGGMPGAANIAADPACVDLIRRQASSDRLLAAICAAPAVVLAPLGLLSGRRFTCYPGHEKDVSGARWSDERVVVDGNIVTSRGAGTAGEWAVEIIAKLFGAEPSQKIAKAVLLK
jgi:4-methyl-5(b-hydroxyethyl)-thiazole monophosphate biosynthesis